MARRKQAPKDLTGIRQRGGTYQVQISGGYDPVTGRQLFLTVYRSNTRCKSVTCGFVESDQAAG